MVRTTAYHEPGAARETIPKTRIAYRPDVDGLRAVAVLSVLFYHAGLCLPGGYVGVDVFFVISGYLITKLILKDVGQGAFSLADFWERRARRLLPALLVVTTTTLAVGWFVLIPEVYASFGRSIAGLALLVSNVHFSRENGVLRSGGRNPASAPHLVPRSGDAVLPPDAGVPLSRGPLQAPAPRVLSPGCGVDPELRPERLRDIPPRLGGVLSAAHEGMGTLRGRSAGVPPGGLARRPAGVAEAAAALGLFLVLAPCFLYDQGTRFPGLLALPPVVGAVLLISGGEARERLPLVNRLLACRPVVFVGMISYSLYLWHWPLFTLARTQKITGLSDLEKALILVFSLVLSVLSWRYVERPFHDRRLLRSRPRLVAVTAMAFLGLMGSGVILHSSKGFEGRLPQEALHFAATGRKDPRFLLELDVKDVPQNVVRYGDACRDAEVLVWATVTRWPSCRPSNPSAARATSRPAPRRIRRRPPCSGTVTSQSTECGNGPSRSTIPSSTSSETRGSETSSWSPPGVPI